MERKTQLHAEEGRQDLHIQREFNVPLELLFKAYTDADMLSQWMGTKVLKLESKKHGSYQFETIDGKGNVVFKANGAIHEFTENKKIVRTFEMENTSFGVQLEVLEFQKLSDKRSKLSIHTIYESNTLRDEHLKMPFAWGIDMAHNRLEEIVNNL